MAKTPIVHWGSPLPPHSPPIAPLQEMKKRMQEQIILLCKWTWQPQILPHLPQKSPVLAVILKGKDSCATAAQPETAFTQWNDWLWQEHTKWQVKADCGRFLKMHLSSCLPKPEVNKNFFWCQRIWIDDHCNNLNIRKTRISHQDITRNGKRSWKKGRNVCL